MEASCLFYIAGDKMALALSTHYFRSGSCGIAAPSDRGSPAAKFTLRLLSRATAAPWPTENDKGSRSLI